MKKFLSLVLALVMTMSLVTISAGAKDFSDDADITYAEAVAVVSAAGIIDGYTDGSFRPEAKLTRGAAAKIICNMILGTTTAAELSADTAPYPDVPTNHTFAGYIAYCQKEGIISGYADGKFYPGNPLTGYAFMKMLLCALGYDAEVEGYTGANWSINVAKQALAIDLDDDIVDTFNGTKQVTREEACLYAFNALNAIMVEYNDKTEVQTGNATVTISGKRTDAYNSTKSDGNIEDDNYMQFAEKYFDDLEAIPTSDDFGRPATKWMWDGEKVGTFSEVADATFVVGDADKPLAELITDGDYMDIDEDDVLADAPIFYNGEYVNDYAALVSDKTVAGKGDIIEVFENSKHDVDTIVVRSYTYAKIDSVDDDLSKALKNNDATYEIELVDIDENGLGLGAYYDDHTDSDKVLNGFNAETYVEDAVIAIAKDSNDYILDSYVVESVTGIPSAARKVDTYAYAGSTGVKNGTITVEGTKYNFAAQFTGLTSSDEVDFDEEYVVYLTAEGYALAVDGEATATLDEVYFLTGVWGEVVRGGDVAYAQLINVKDGTVLEVLLDDDGDEADTDALLTTATLAYPAFAYVGGFYEIDDDGKLYDLKEYKGTATYSVLNGSILADEVTGNDTVIRVSGGTAYESKAAATAPTRLYIEDTTFFALTEEVGASMSVKTATGMMTMQETYEYDNSGVAATEAVEVYAIYDGKDAVSVIYVAEKDDADTKSATDKTDIVYLTDDPNTKTTKDTYVVNLVKMDGMETLESVEIDDDEITSGDDEGFYTYVLKDGVYELETEASNMLDYFGGEVTEDSDGYEMGVVFNGVKNLTATSADGKFIAIDFSEATVIDTRSGSAKKADIYSNTINSTSRLAAAIDKCEDFGGLTANVYVENGEIIFVAVYACPDDSTPAPGSGVTTPAYDTVTMDPSGNISYQYADAAPMLTDIRAAVLELTGESWDAARGDSIVASEAGYAVTVNGITYTVTVSAQPVGESSNA